MNFPNGNQAEVDDAIAVSMDELRKGIDEALHIPPAPVRPPIEPPSELERFLASGERLLETLRQRMLASESRYELERVRVADGFRVRMRNLEHEAAEALRALDRRHAAKAAADRKLLDVLTGMRGA